MKSTQAAFERVSIETVSLRCGPSPQALTEEEASEAGASRERFGERKVSAKPFLKWAGGKSKLLPELLERMPAELGGRYFEPFLGGGALFFATHGGNTQAPSHGLSDGVARVPVLSDVNPELVNAYRVVRDDLDALLRLLRAHKHNKRYYYRIRDADRDPGYWTWAPLERASRLIYLNKTCFNGLYRVNSRGEFNVPFGDYESPTIADEDNLRACSAALAGADIECASFESVSSIARAGDFVYFDPPYAPVSATAHFTGYAKGGFSADLQRSLADVCRSLDQRGVRFMLSNSNAPLVVDLYRSFRVETVYAPRAINAKGDRRGKVAEIIVRNY